MRPIYLLLALGGLCLPAAATSAQSIWAYRRPDRVFMFSDTAAKHVGDLVTIVIRENTDVENNDARSMEKDSQSDFALDFSSSGDLGSSAGAVDYATDSGRAFNGSSQYSVEQEFQDRITVPVLDVLPNGNLVIGGRRRRLVAGELRTLVVSGTVRPWDIAPDNTVRSQFVSNFKICYDGDGPESHFSNQGWGSRLINKIWPF